MDENSEIDDRLSARISNTAPTATQASDHDIHQVDGVLGNSAKCSDDSNERVAMGCNSSNKSTGAPNANERKIKFSRPSEHFLHNLKQSILWSNLTQMDNNCHEKLWNVSQHLLDGTFIEWSKRVWGNHCSAHNSTENLFATHFAQKLLQSKENIVSSNENGAICKTESDETVQHLTEYFKNWIAMNGKSSRNLKNSEKVPHHVDILILGGGLAGLGAATTIHKAQTSGKKCSYLILEAQGQAGGRVKSGELLKSSSDLNASYSSDNNLVDGGAQWLHGRNNFLYTVSEKNQLLTPHQSEEGLGAFFYENSTQVDSFLVKKVDFHIGQLLGKCEEFARQTKCDNYPKSVGHFLREHFQKFVENLDSRSDKQIANDLFDWHMRFQIIDNSCLSLDQLSAKYWGKYSFNGESCQAHYNFKNGFGSVVDRLINELSNDAIHCNKEVIEIHIHNKRTEVNNNARPNQNDQNEMPIISVKCLDGSLFTANHILVTFSLGVLKKAHKTMFWPALPRSIQTAIESIGFETINKIFLEFDTPWWQDLDGIQFVFDHKEEKTKWSHYLTGFDVLKPNHPNMLLGWVGGTGAIQMEALTDNQIIDDCVQLLTKFTNKNVPHPVRYYCTRWHSNRYVNGAYSYISTECDNNDTIPQHLLGQPLTIDDFDFENDSTTERNSGMDTAMPAKQSSPTNSVPKLPIVLFAGEACHVKYFSTAHGAFVSGFEQAQKIIKFYE